MTTAAVQRAPGGRSAVREFFASVATIMVKELRSRMRGRRAFVVLTAYLALLATIAYGVYLAVAPLARNAAAAGFGDAEFQAANVSSLIGMAIFSVLSILQIVLVSVIAPAFTAGQISLEREKQTLDLLVTTPLRPGAIVIGKLATALAFVVLMILAAIPISGLVLMYGGAQVMDIVRQQAVLLATAIGFGAVGIFASALTKRTQSATVVTYGAVLGAIIGSAMLFSFWQSVSRADDPLFLRPNGGAPEQIRFVNPMVAMLDVVSNVEPPGGTDLTQPLYRIFGEDLSGNGLFAPDAPDQFGRDVAAPLIDTRTTGYWWPRVSITLLAAAAVLTLAAMRLIVPTPIRWWPRPRRDVPGTTITEEAPR
jgi:ABC-type transport system involved in multi-copper enzyme maturation permease subunit